MSVQTTARFNPLTQVCTWSKIINALVTLRGLLIDEEVQDDPYSTSAVSGT